MFLRPIPRQGDSLEDAQLREALVALAELLKGAKPTEIPGFVRVPVVHNAQGDHVHVHVPHPRFPAGHPRAGEPMPVPGGGDHTAQAELHAAALHQAETTPIHAGGANAVMRLITPGQPHRYMGVRLPNPKAAEIANYSGVTGRRHDSPHKLAAFHPADAHGDAPGVHFHVVEPEGAPEDELPEAAYRRSVARHTIFAEPHAWTPESGFQAEAQAAPRPYATFRTVENDGGGREHAARYVTPWLPRLREGPGGEGAPSRKPGELRLSEAELQHLRSTPPMHGEARMAGGAPFARWALEQLPARSGKPGLFRYHARASLDPGTYTEGQLKRQHEYEWELEGDASARARALRRLHTYLEGHAERLSHLREKASQAEPTRLADPRTVDELREQHGGASNLIVDPQARAKIGEVIETRRRGGHSKQTLAHRRLALDPDAMEKLALDWEAENQPGIERLTQHLSRRYRFLSDDQIAEAVRSGIRDAIGRFDPKKGALGSFVRAHAEGRAGGLARGAGREREAAFAHYEDRGEDVRPHALGQARSAPAPVPAAGATYDDLMDRRGGHPQEYERLLSGRLGLDRDSVALLAAANPTGDPAHGVDHEGLARAWEGLGRGRLPDHVIDTLARAQQQIWQSPEFREYHDRHIAPLQGLRDEAWKRESGGAAEKSLARLFATTCRAVNGELWRRDFGRRRAAVA